jgi:hypothetical protein
MRKDSDRARLHRILTSPRGRRRSDAQKSGTAAPSTALGRSEWEKAMNGIIYLVGLVVVILAILSFLGLR